MSRINYIPRSYQDETHDHLTDLPRCAALLRMGLGKTVSTYTALETLDTCGYDTYPALVLAPKRVALNTWPDEAAKWSHLSRIGVVPIVGSGAECHAALAQLMRGDGNVATINYENVPWLVDQLGGKWPFPTVIADESTRLKSFRLTQGGKRARALATIAHNKTKRWINLTGTPSPNGLQDLWGQMWFLDAGRRLGRSYTAFTGRWFQREWDGYGVSALPHAMTEINERIGDLCLSIDPRDHFALEEPIETIIEIELPQKARALYRSMEKDFFMQVEEHGVTAANAGVKSNKLLQLANGAAYVGESKEWKEVHDAKISALESIIEEAAGAPVLVAYHFKSDLARILAAFPRARELDDAPATIRGWNAGKIPVLVAHPASAGHGLNLQDGGNIIAFFGHNWNLEEYEQIIERIGPVRQFQSGHDRNVYIYHIVAKDTVEEVCVEKMKTKADTQTLLMNALKQFKRRIQ